MAPTALEQHAAAMAEVQQVLNWAWLWYPGAHGPTDDGNDWDHDLQLTVEDWGSPICKGEQFKLKFDASHCRQTRSALDLQKRYRVSRKYR